MKIKMPELKSKKFSDMFKDNKEVIILILECAIILGLFYYFNKKISKLSKHIEEISQKIELQDDLIEKQNLTITELTLNANTSFNSNVKPVEVQPNYLFQTKEQTKKVSPEPKPILKTSQKTKESAIPPQVVPKVDPKVVSQKPQTKVPPQVNVEPPRVKFVQPTNPEIDIFQFLHRPQNTQNTPQKTTQEIEILEEEPEDEEESIDNEVELNEEELLDKQLESEMRDLD